MKIGYIIPEWPGQTHLWIWREISHLREWNVAIQIFSTRRPPERDKGRHAFAEAAAGETTYLWPMSVGRMVVDTLGAFFRSPIGFLRCLWLALTLPVDAPWWRFSVLKLIPVACRLSAELRRAGVDHLHSHTASNSAILCMMVKRLCGAPFTMVVNANIEWWGGAMREKFREAQVTLFVTNWMVVQMRRDFADIPAEKYGLGRVGADTRRWCPLPAESHPPRAADAPLRVLSVGRLVASKGFPVLLRAVAILKQQAIRLQVRIGGNGDLRDELLALVKELDIGDAVTFLGSLSEEQYLEEMRAADVFVLASNAEPMGVVYTEAMSVEVATVGTAAGGVGEIITDGVDGLLVPPRNPEMLAEALRRLALDGDFRRRLGVAGRRRILEEFDSRLWAAELHRRLFGHAPPGYADAVARLLEAAPRGLEWSPMAQAPSSPQGVAVSG